MTLSLIFIWAISCNKHEGGEEIIDQDTITKTDSSDSLQKFKFISLSSKSDTIFTGESVEIEALAEGEGLTYMWSANAGDILGSGSNVIYVAPTCTPGKNEIKCIISDKHNKTEFKTIFIVVI